MGRIAQRTIKEVSLETGVESWRAWSVDRFPAGVPLLVDLDQSELQLLADSISERTFLAGEVVTTEGEPADGFFVVESGEADVTVQGQRRATFVAGDYFGEIALLMGSDRTATITATSDLHCYCLSPCASFACASSAPTRSWKSTGLAT